MQLLVPPPPQIDRGPLSSLPPTIAWVGGADGHVELIDQTLLPAELRVTQCRSADDVWSAIRRLAVRGAPAIGVAGAYGLCLGTRALVGAARDEWTCGVDAAAAHLIACRPTAVNLAWAVRRAQRAGAARLSDGPAAAWIAMLAESHTIWAQDAETCRRIGETGESLVPDGGGVLTHCNAGALATVAYGTALAPLYLAHARGKRFTVYADETRPLLQGARLTAYELSAAGIAVRVLCDGAAASLLRSGAVQIVLVGADRIAANGDFANKIGTYGLALAAHRHHIPFYVAAPCSTIDERTPSGESIEIEQRSAGEVRGAYGAQWMSESVACWNPAFDVTPAELVTGFVTEAGVVQPVSAGGMMEILRRGGCKGTAAV